MSWIGGKKSMRELIVSLFPLYYERYIEVFGGGGWVLFHKPPGNDFEVYNDFNSLLVNLYRCVRAQYEDLQKELKYVLNSREDFDDVRAVLDKTYVEDDVKRAAYFYQLIRYSYASGLTSFGSQPHDIRSNFPIIEQAHRRLAKVVIENKDFEKLIRQYDRPISFFYLDPPYFDTEKYYKNVGEGGFQKEDHIRLRDTLLGIEGKFLLSYNDCEYIRELYDAPGIIIDPEQAEVVKRIYREYLSGNSLLKIKRSLEADGVLNGAGRGKWNESNIKQILTNEKYIGDALLQKTYTVDILEKKREANKGQVPKYYVEGSYESIIPKDIFIKMQEELVRRANLTKGTTQHSTNVSITAGTHYQEWYSVHIAAIYFAASSGTIEVANLRFGVVLAELTKTVLTAWQEQSMKKAFKKWWLRP